MDKEMLDILGHVAYSSLAFGMFLLARKNLWGWVFRFIGEVGWLWIGVQMGMSSIWTWGLLFLAMEVYGFWSWRRDGPPA